MGIAQSARADRGTRATTALGSPLKMCMLWAGECWDSQRGHGLGLSVMELNGILAIPDDSKGRQQGNPQEKGLSGLKWGSKL